MKLLLLALICLPIAAQTTVDLSGPVRGEMAVRGSSFTLTVGTCSLASPCNVRQGSLVRSYVSPATINIAAGSGTVYLYVDRSGNIAAGAPSSGLSILCSGCLVASGVTSFPIGSVPLATWTASAGTWTQGTDQTALLSSAPAILAGPNITVTQTNSDTTIGAP